MFSNEPQKEKRICTK